MFAKESLVQFLAGAGCFSVIQTLLLTVLGALFVSNEHYHQLLGNTVKHVGGGLVFIGLLYLVAAALGYFSARMQNKFLLLVQFVLLALLLFLQTLVASVSLGKSVPTLRHDEQVACLTVGRYSAMALPQQQVCDAFVRSDAFAGITLVWQSYYTHSLQDGAYRAMVLDLQKENFCCGSGLPQHCFDDVRPFPTAYPSTEIAVKVQQRVKCDIAGVSVGAYVATKDCAVNGRCDYDLPYGLCGLNPVTTATRGCGAFVFANLSAQVRAISIVALVALLFPVAFLIASVCLCFKRRDDDVLPSIDFVSKVQIHAEA